MIHLFTNFIGGSEIVTFVDASSVLITLDLKAL